ncbi:MAG: universal stress protein [Candidatus Bathyarchaeia archaeon]
MILGGINVRANQIKKIMVAVDGSKNSLRAGKLAVNLAKKPGSQLIVVSVIVRPSYMRTGPQYFSAARREWHKKWDDQVLNLAGSVGVRASARILQSASVVQALLDFASSKKVDLIVVGTRGLGTFKRLLIGSVSSAVVNHATCSVLVVR